MKKIVILLVVVMLSGCSFFQKQNSVIDMQMEKKVYEESNSLRSPRYLY